MVRSEDSITFEVIVVLAIVAIVAFTGNVLMSFDASIRAGAGIGAADASGNLISGFAVAEDASESSAADLFTDLSVERIEVNPANPLIGDPFEVRVFVKNKGNTEIKTPFTVSAEFIPKTPETDLELSPMTLQEMIPKILLPGEETYVSFLVTTIIPEGPMRVVATADPTVKIADNNPSNNQLSKTFIISVE
ncbi:hypothetical protein JW711_05925 [Candidatus Woesearchaeota archaeon]|nr:hypothetical protein [Candidatus Woesearchaeota archaeon]